MLAQCHVIWRVHVTKGCIWCCRAKIVEGRVAKTLKTVALLEQPFIKDGDKSVSTIIKEASVRAGREHPSAGALSGARCLPFPEPQNFHAPAPLKPLHAAASVRPENAHQFARPASFPSLSNQMPAGTLDRT